MNSPHARHGRNDGASHTATGNSFLDRHHTFDALCVARQRYRIERPDTSDLQNPHMDARLGKALSHR